MFLWASIQPSTQPTEVEAGQTREVQEARLLELYNAALREHAQGGPDHQEEAAKLLQELLDSPLLLQSKEQTLIRLHYLGLKNLGAVKEEQKEPEAALVYYSKAADVDGSDPNLWLHLARLSKEAGHLRAARYAYEQTLRCHPGNWLALEALPDVLEKLGDLAGAVRACRAAIRVDPTHTHLHDKLTKLRQWMQGSSHGAVAIVVDGEDGGEESGGYEEEKEAHITKKVDVVLGESGNRAWIELGTALLTAFGQVERLEGEGLKAGSDMVVTGPIRLVVRYREDEEEGEGASTSKGKTNRITEEMRLQSLRGPGADGETEERLKSNQPSQVRRLSSRQAEKKEARTSLGTGDPKDVVRAWLNSITEQSSHPTDKSVWRLDVSWWEGLCSSSTNKKSSSVSLDDEGPNLAKELLQPFRGTHNSQCHKCGWGGDLLCCETCNVVYHVPCLLKPPARLQDLYCDECVAEAYQRSKGPQPPPQTTDPDVFLAQRQEVARVFVPSVKTNIGSRHVMVSLIQRLADLSEPRVWEGEQQMADMRAMVFRLEEAARDTARDIQSHLTYVPDSLKQLDFGLRAEVLLAELHFDQVLASLQGLGPTSPHHLQAVDVFISRFLAALQDEKYSTGLTPDNNCQGIIFPSTLLARFWWLCGLRYGWNHHINEACQCLELAEKALEATQDGNEGVMMSGRVEEEEVMEVGRPFEIELPHCRWNPVINMPAIKSKRKELTSSSDLDVGRCQVEELRRVLGPSHTEEEEKRAPQVMEEFLDFIRVRFVDVEGRTRVKRTEEILLDFLIEEGTQMTEMLVCCVDGSVAPLEKALGTTGSDGIHDFCQDVGSIPTAIRHGSLLMLALGVGIQRQQLVLLLGLMSHVLWYLTERDSWAAKLLLDFKKRCPAAFERWESPRAGKLDVGLLEALALLLAKAVEYTTSTTSISTKGGSVPASQSSQESQKESDALAPSRVLHVDLLREVAARVPPLARMSLYPFSQSMLEGIMDTCLALRAREADTANVMATATIRSLCGIICDDNLSSAVLLHYVNGKQAQGCRISYLKTALEYLGRLLLRVLGDEYDDCRRPTSIKELRSRRRVKPSLQSFLKEEEWSAVLSSLSALLEITENQSSPYATLYFPVITCTTALLRAKMSLRDLLPWYQMAHEALGSLHLCVVDKGAFLRSVVVALMGETEAETVSGGASQSSDGPFPDEMRDKLVSQCFHCLYGVQILPGWVSHGVEPRPIKGAQACLDLALFTVTHLESGASKKDLVTALERVSKHPLFKSPIACSTAFPVIQDYLFSCDPDQSLPAPIREWDGRHEEEEEEEDEDLLYCGMYQDLEVGPATKEVLLVFRKLYRGLVELSSRPRMTIRKRELTYQTEYEKECLDMVRICLLDFRFRPTRFKTWVELSDRLTRLLFLSLDNLTDTRAGLDRAAQALRQAEGHIDLAGLLVPALDQNSKDSIKKRLKGVACLAPLLGSTRDEDTGADPDLCTANNTTSLDEKEGEPLTKTGTDPIASLVIAALQQVYERCLVVVTTLVDRRVYFKPTGERETIVQGVTARLNLALWAYIQRLGEGPAGPGGPSDLTLLERARDQAREAELLEERFNLKRRWDLSFLLGKVTEKMGRAEHPNKPYSVIEMEQPGWLELVLSYYQRACTLAESKNAKVESFYRLHATRLKAVLSDLHPDGTLAAPNLELLSILRRYSLKADDSSSAVQMVIEGEEGDAELVRWRVIEDCWEAMNQCRKKDQWNHRSLYRKAKALSVLSDFVPLNHPERFWAICVEGTENETARDLMHLLFDRKRPQVVAAWIVEEASDTFEFINARSIKFDRLRMKYTRLYMDLLKECKDFPKISEMYKWMKTLRDQTSVTEVLLQFQTRLTLIDVLKSVVPDADRGPTQDALTRCGGYLEMAYELRLELCESRPYLLSSMEAPTNAVILALAVKMRALEATLAAAMGSATDESDNHMPSAAPQQGVVPLPEGSGSNVVIATEDQALEWCHDKWPTKGGRTKLHKKMLAQRAQMRRELRAASESSCRPPSRSTSDVASSAPPPTIDDQTRPPRTLASLLLQGFESDGEEEEERGAGAATRGMAMAGTEEGEGDDHQSLSSAASSSRNNKRRYEDEPGGGASASTAVRRSGARSPHSSDEEHPPATSTTSSRMDPPGGSTIKPPSAINYPPPQQAGAVGPAPPRKVLVIDDSDDSNGEEGKD